MENTKQNTGKRSFQPLLWFILYIINLGLILLFQSLFIHTYDRPITKESLAEIPYFSGCEILDMSMEEDITGPGYVLFRDADGQLKVIELDYNLFLPKFAIDEKSLQTISDDGIQIAEFHRLTGSTQITVENQEIIQHSSQLDDGGADRWDYIYMGLALLLAEGAVILIIEKLKKKKPAGG